MGVFVSEPSALIGLVCVQRGRGSRPREHGVKGEVSSWKYRARDGKRAEACRMGFWGLGNQCDGSEGTLQELFLLLLNKYISFSFFSALLLTNSHNICVSFKGYCHYF